MILIEKKNQKREREVQQEGKDTFVALVFIFKKKGKKDGGYKVEKETISEYSVCFLPVQTSGLWG